MVGGHTFWWVCGRDDHPCLEILYGDVWTGPNAERGGFRRVGRKTWSSWLNLVFGVSQTCSYRQSTSMNTDTLDPKRILVVEDTKAVAFLIEAVLQLEGYLVEVSEDGEGGLERVRCVRPDLIVLDLMLPGIHGMEVLRRLKADPETAGIIVIMCTARKYKPDYDQAMELGAYAVLSKPFEREELVEVVQRALAGEAPMEPHIQFATMEGRVEVSSAEKTRDRWYYRCWGTRGSIPVSGSRFVRHGGNTSCVELGLGDEILIVDAGSGLRDLGVELARRGPRTIHLLITHTHWDHIQGFPFFAPAYIPGFKLVIYGALGFGADLKSAFTGQLNREYFPVQFEDMRASIEFRHLETQGLEVGPFRVFWEYTHHPAATVCFRIEAGGKSLGYVSDNEFLYGYQGAPERIKLESEALVLHRRMVSFMAGVDVLLGEAQYTNEEYPSKVGWGHSSIGNASILASLAEVRTWVVTHHDPDHDDEFLDRKLNATKDILSGLGSRIPVSHAYDGLMDYLY